MTGRTGNDSWRARIDRLEERILEYRQWSTMETIRFLALSLCGEAGELANEIKKEWRADGFHNWDQQRTQDGRKKIADEIADCQMLIYRLAANMNIDIDTACDNKIDELDQRSDLVVK